MPSTPNMGMVLPTVSTTLGPTWAQELNDALSLNDAHDHSSGKGVKITPAGLNINVALDFQDNNLLNVAAVEFMSTAVTNANLNSIYAVLGNLYFNNGSGTPIQITAAGALVPSPGVTVAYARTLVNASTTINPSDTFVVVEVDTTPGPITVVLPACNSVADGRIYMIKDVKNNARVNAITVLPSGADTLDQGSSVIIDSRGASIAFVGDATSNYAVV